MQNTQATRTGIRAQEMGKGRTDARLAIRQHPIEGEGFRPKRVVALPKSHDLLRPICMLSAERTQKPRAEPPIGPHLNFERKVKYVVGVCVRFLLFFKSGRRRCHFKRAKETEIT